jgi:hypothetical protein
MFFNFVNHIFFKFKVNGLLPFVSKCCVLKSSIFKFKVLVSFIRNSKHLLLYGLDSKWFLIYGFFNFLNFHLLEF